MKSRLLAFILLLALLAGCAPAATEAAPTSIPPTPTIPAPPTLTATATVPLAVLIIPADIHEAESQLYQTTVYNMAQAQGWRFQVRNSLSSADYEPGMSVVIALPPDPGMAELAAAMPQVQFLAVNIPGVVAAPNLSVVGSGGTRPDQVAFLAGYMAAMLALDWHAGVIVERDTPEGTNTRTAFRNGVEFFCGLCNPSAGPFLDYPLYVDIPVDEKPEAYPAYAEYLIRNSVEVVYIQPSLAKPELMEALANAGVSIIGTSTPNERISNSWVATIQPDLIYAIQAAWPQLVAGQGGMDVPSPYTLSSINAELLTIGKQRLAQEMLAELLAGRVDTGVR